MKFIEMTHENGLQVLVGIGEICDVSALVSNVNKIAITNSIDETQIFRCSLNEFRTALGRLGCGVAIIEDSEL